MVAFTSFSQTLTLVLKSWPTGTRTDSIFVAGNFNGWQPANASFRFDNHLQLKIAVEKGAVVAFKCTLGSWKHSEVSGNGTAIDNRTLLIAGDTTLEIDIEGWSHHFSSATKKQSASAQVRMLDTALLMKALQTSRTIRVYLPPDYDNSTYRFPVLYMHDGQNLFDESTASFGEWQVDEALDSMYKASGLGLIVVAVDHGGSRRIAEYSPYDVPQLAKGEGMAYTDFLVNQLKPLIDEQFRTLPQKENTWIAGSSMGGVISLFAVFQYPHVFGGAGIFSPALWTAPSLFSTAARFAAAQPGNSFYFYAGGMESERMLPEMQTMADITRSSKNAVIKVETDAAGKHQESAWATYFHHFLAFIQQSVPALKGNRFN